MLLATYLLELEIFWVIFVYTKTVKFLTNYGRVDYKTIKNVAA